MHFCVFTMGQQENVTYIADIRIKVTTNHAVGKTQKYIYDLDTAPVTTRRWTDVENVRMIWDFFQEHKAEFEK